MNKNKMFEFRMEVVDDEIITEMFTNLNGSQIGITFNGYEVFDHVDELILILENDINDFGVLVVENGASIYEIGLDTDHFYILMSSELGVLKTQIVRTVGVATAFLNSLKDIKEGLEFLTID